MLVTNSSLIGQLIEYNSYNISEAQPHAVQSLVECSHKVR